MDVRLDVVRSRTVREPGVAEQFFVQRQRVKTNHVDGDGHQDLVLCQGTLVAQMRRQLYAGIQPAHRQLRRCRGFDRAKLAFHAAFGQPGPLDPEEVG